MGWFDYSRKQPDYIQTFKIKEMRTQVTKKEFREIQGIEYGKCPFITMGNEEQINFHAGIIDRELNQKYEVVSDEEKRAILVEEIAVLKALQEEKFSNIDIESPMSKEENSLMAKIAKKYSQINQIIREKRKLKIKEMKNQENSTVKFEVGNIHYMQFIGDSNLKPRWIVVKRTPKTVTFERVLKPGVNFEINHESLTRKTRVYRGVEYIHEGNYSMAPSIYADKIVG